MTASFAPPDDWYEDFLARQWKRKEKELAWDLERERQESQFQTLHLIMRMNAEQMGQHFVNCMALAMNPNISDAYLAKRMANPPKSLELPIAGLHSGPLGPDKTNSAPESALSESMTEEPTTRNAKC